MDLDHASAPHAGLKRRRSPPGDSSFHGHRPDGALEPWNPLAPSQDVPQVSSTTPWKQDHRRGSGNSLDISAPASGGPPLSHPSSGPNSGRRDSLDLNRAAGRPRDGGTSSGGGSSGGGSGGPQGDSRAVQEVSRNGPQGGPSPAPSEDLCLRWGQRKRMRGTRPSTGQNASKSQSSAKVSKRDPHPAASASSGSPDVGPSENRRRRPESQSEPLDAVGDPDLTAAVVSSGLKISGETNRHVGITTSTGDSKGAHRHKKRSLQETSSGEGEEEEEEEEPSHAIPRAVKKTEMEDEEEALGGSRRRSGPPRPSAAGASCAAVPLPGEAASTVQSEPKPCVVADTAACMTANPGPEIELEQPMEGFREDGAAPRQPHGSECRSRGVDPNQNHGKREPTNRIKEVVDDKGSRVAPGESNAEEGKQTSRPQQQQEDRDGASRIHGEEEHERTSLLGPGNPEPMGFQAPKAKREEETTLPGPGVGDGTVDFPMGPGNSDAWKAEWVSTEAELTLEVEPAAGAGNEPEGGGEGDGHAEHTVSTATAGYYSHSSSKSHKQHHHHKHKEQQHQEKEDEAEKVGQGHHRHHHFQKPPSSHRQQQQHHHNHQKHNNSVHASHSSPHGSDQGRRSHAATVTPPAAAAAAAVSSGGGEVAAAATAAAASGTVGVRGREQVSSGRTAVTPNGPVTPPPEGAAGGVSTRRESARAHARAVAAQLSAAGAVDERKGASGAGHSSAEAGMSMGTRQQDAAIASARQHHQHHQHQEEEADVAPKGDKKQKGGGGGEAQAVEVPKFLLSLSRAEKEDDFYAIKGSKLPQRPRKRAKAIERGLQRLLPGAWLCNVTKERYEVRERRALKKKPRGLKAMNGLESDSE